jgi:hypothetical protein
MAQFVETSARSTEQHQSNQVAADIQSVNPLESSTFSGTTSSEYLLTMHGQSTSTSQHGLRNIANSEFEREMRSRFSQSTEEQLSLSSYENFNKMKIGERLIINQAGQEKYLELIGNQWQEIKKPDVIEVLGKELQTLTTNDFNSILKSIFPSSNSETFERFTNHNKFRLGYNLVIQAQDSKDFYQLSGQKWEKIVDPNMLEQLQGSDSLDSKQDQVTAVTRVAMNRAFNLAGELNNSVSENQVNIFRATLTNALESVLTPIFEYKIAKEEERNPKEALDLMITGLTLKKNIAGTETEQKGIDSDIEVLKYCKDALELRFPHHWVEVQNSDVNSIPKTLQDYEARIDYCKRIYSTANVSALEDALKTGEINGKVVDQQIVEENLHQANVMKAFLAGKYNTSEGHPSVYGETVLESIFNSEESMEKLGLRPAAYVAKNKRGPGEHIY